MSSERLPGEAGVIQPVLEAEASPAVNIITEQLAQTSPLVEGVRRSILDRLRNKWTTVGAVVLTGLVLAEAPSFEASPAQAANTETAVIGMPFDGKWAYPANVNPPYTDVNSSHPSVHALYSANWATDVYAVPGTEAKFNISSISGAGTYTVGNVAETSCGAGKRVRVNIKVDNVSVGWVQYEHLETDLTDGTTLASGAVLGKTKRWTDTEGKPLSCYPVSNDAGVHLHVGMKNVEDKYSCYVDHGNPGTSLSVGANLGVLGSTNNGEKQACTEVPSSGGGGTPPSNTTIL